MPGERRGVSRHNSKEDDDEEEEQQWHERWEPEHSEAERLQNRSCRQAGRLLLPST